MFAAPAIRPATLPQPTRTLNFGALHGDTEAGRPGCCSEKPPAKQPSRNWLGLLAAVAGVFALGTLPHVDSIVKYGRQISGCGSLGEVPDTDTFGFGGEDTIQNGYILITNPTQIRKLLEQPLIQAVRKSTEYPLRGVTTDQIFLRTEAKPQCWQAVATNQVPAGKITEWQQQDGFYTQINNYGS